MSYERKKITLYRQPKSSSTTKQVSRFVGRASSKAIDKSVEMFSDSQSQINEDFDRKLEIYGSIYRSQSLIASMALNKRRVQKSIESYERVVATGEPDSHFRTILDWIEIHFLFLCEVIWSAITTFLAMILTIVLQLVITIAVTAFVFWLIWWFIML